MKLKKLLLILAILFIIIDITIILAYIVGGQEQDNWKLWKRTATTEIWKNTKTGEYRRTIGQGALYVDDESRRFPNYVPFNQVVNMSFNKSDGSIIYSYKTKKREFSVTAKIGFILSITQTACNNQGWTWFDVGPGYCGVWANQAYSFMKNNNIGHNVLIKDNTYSYKYAVNLTKIPLTYRDKIKYIGLRLEDVDGLTWDDISKSGQSIMIKDKIKLSYSDLLENHFTLNLYDKKTVLIGNISNQENLWLDPTVTLGSQPTLDKVSVDQANPNTVLSSTPACTSSNGTRYRLYSKINISELYSLDIFDITATTLGGIRLTNGDGGCTWDVYHVFSHSWNSHPNGDSLSSSTMTWNNQTCGPTLNNDTNCNTTVIDSDEITGGGLSPSFNFLGPLKLEYNEANQNLTFMVTGRDCGGLDTNWGLSSYYGVLDITYTPYIDILSPTDGQIFTEDAPTTNFTIKNNTLFDKCYVELGQYNLTLGYNGGNIYNLTNTSMIDGSWTNAKFWCNETVTGTWEEIRYSKF